MTEAQDVAASIPVPPSEFEALDAFHQEVLAKLKLALRLADHLGQAGIDATARAIATEIIDFFSATAREHHAEEERVVFPLLIDDAAGDDAELVQHVKRLQQDHGWLEEDWIELSPQLRAVSEGHGGYDLDTLRAAIVVFTELNLDHLELEESLIYPEAKRRMAERTAVGLGRKHAKERHTKAAS